RIPPPTIQILNGPVRRGKPVQFKVDWAGTWNNFDFNCGSWQGSVYYIPKGQSATCTYEYIGYGVAHAALYYQNDYKIEAQLLIVVLPPEPVYLSIVRR